MVTPPDMQAETGEEQEGSDDGKSRPPPLSGEEEEASRPEPAPIPDHPADLQGSGGAEGAQRAAKADDPKAEVEDEAEGAQGSPQGAGAEAHGKAQGPGRQAPLPPAGAGEGQQGTEGLAPHTKYLLQHAVSVKTRARYQSAQTSWLAFLGKGRSGTEADFADWLAGEQLNGNLAAGSLQARIAAVNDLRVSQGQTRFIGGLAARVVQGTAVLNPRRPARVEAFDLDLLIEFIREKKGSNADLSDKDLLGKMGTLAEMHGLRAADLVSAIWQGTMVEADQHDIKLMVLPKETKKRKYKLVPVPGPPDAKANEQHSLCVHCVLLTWLQRVGQLGALKKNPGAIPCLRFSTRHKTAACRGRQVSADHLRNCINSLMQQAGLPCVFKAHAIRSAAASKAAERGVPVAQILAIYRWSARSHTMQRHYLFATQQIASEVGQAIIPGPKPSAAVREAGQADSE